MSAFLTPRGVAAELLRVGARGGYVVCLSQPILTETANSLLRSSKLRARYGFGKGEVEAFCRDLADSAAMMAELPTIEAVPSDPEDNPIVATAVAARADYLVTGDRRHLLPVGSYGGVRIVTVRAFLESVVLP